MTLGRSGNLAESPHLWGWDNAPPRACGEADRKDARTSPNTLMMHERAHLHSCAHTGARKPPAAHGRTCTHTHTHNAQTCRDTCTHRRVEAPRLTQSYGAGAWAPGCSGGGLCLANPVVQRLLPEEFGPLDGWKGQGQHSEALRVGRTGFSRLGLWGLLGREASSRGLGLGG